MYVFGNLLLCSAAVMYSGISAGIVEIHHLKLIMLCGSSVTKPVSWKPTKTNERRPIKLSLLPRDRVYLPWVYLMHKSVCTEEIIPQS